MDGYFGIRRHRGVPRLAAPAMVLLLAGCCLFGDAAPIFHRSNVAAIPDAEQRSPAVEITDGLSLKERDTLVDWMAAGIAQRGEEEETRSRLARDYKALFDLLTSAPCLNDLKSSGRIGRLCDSSLPNDGRLDGADARYDYQVRPGDIVVVVLKPFALAFYRLPVNAFHARPGDCADEASDGTRYPHVLVLPSSVVFARE